MSTVFKTTLGPILSLGKILGLINISHILESDGLLIKNINSQYYTFLEVSRMIVLIICTYIVHTNTFYYIIEFRLVKFWFVVITGRLSEKWTIKLINSIIEFDENISLLSPAVILNERKWFLSKTNWNYILISFFVYFIGFEVYAVYIWPPKDVNIYIIIVYFFGVPYITDYVVFITVFFYLVNIAYRFQTINNYWKFLPAGLVATSSEWAHHEIVMLIENIRMLHAKLSEILKIFNLGYGLLLLHFFVFNFIDMMYLFYTMIKHEFLSPNVSFIEGIIHNLPLYIFKLQIVISIMLIIVATSWIKEKKNKIVSYLRLIQISNLPVDIKIQIKMFMVQISNSELDEISAFGFFNINMNLVVSMLVLLMTGITTLIQMKNHPIISEMLNNTVWYRKNWVRN
ncbi:uncharacterized protein LOC113548139 [Rhopalosiphum maidis]|uniref:uncharacterized protein LOC113548139 n=1 Tax=Rhopalosiphum maidis TaxID=43146 RepID=UPI000F00FACF|nr:uncharacterized protein LOC113548139 [Rhopalosiphum maidis]